MLRGMTTYRIATLTPPSAPSSWSVLRTWALRWYWTRYATALDWQRADVREAIGGEWERFDAPWWRDGVWIPASMATMHRTIVALT